MQEDQGDAARTTELTHRGFVDEKNPVLLYFIFTRWPLQDQFYLRNANATSHQEKQCHILIKRSWHEQTATLTINKNVGEQNKTL